MLVGRFGISRQYAGAVRHHRPSHHASRVGWAYGEYDFRSRSTDFDWKLNFSQILGKQSLKFGYEFMAIRTQVNDINPLYGRDADAGNYSGGGGTNGSLADFYFGLRSQYALATTWSATTANAGISFTRRMTFA